VQLDIKGGHSDRMVATMTTKASSVHITWSTGPIPWRRCPLVQKRKKLEHNLTSKLLGCRLQPFSYHEEILLYCA